MDRVRRRIRILGRVQGVGFRPFLAREASKLGLAGFCRNRDGAVEVEVEGPAPAIARFEEAVRLRAPEAAEVRHVHSAPRPLRGGAGFRIDESRGGGAGGGEVPVDRPVCAPCVEELFDPASRRYRYAFTHCAVCGPRASVLTRLPYDREHSALAAFAPCAACLAEYRDPASRRFHAQTLCCPACGPHLFAVRPGGAVAAGDPVELAARELAAGGIVAIRGYGGFHLCADACNEEAVARLRERKRRPRRPFAILVADLGCARRLAVLHPEDEALLAGPARPVLVAPARPEGARAIGLARGIAPGVRDLGIALPCAPVHHLLLLAPGSQPGTAAPRFRALVFTSANRSGAPTLHRTEDALRELRGVADLVLAHDRAVVHPSDDPVFRTGGPRSFALRLGRGESPRVLPLPVHLAGGDDGIAVGGDEKCAPAVVAGGRVFLDGHLGDQGDIRAAEELRKRLAWLIRQAGARPAWVASDAHPEYRGTRFAEALGLPRIPVQHHHAHAAAALAEHGRAGPALGWILDGFGFGDDGGAWGGELLVFDFERAERFAHLEAVALVGGDRAAREPWRSAVAWLVEAGVLGQARGLPWWRRQDPARVARILEAAARPALVRRTSSCGRLFDAVSSLLDCADHALDEGHAARELEALAEAGREAGDAPLAEACSPLPRPRPGAGRAVPVRDLVARLVAERRAGVPRGRCAWRFHLRLARRLADAACRAAEQRGLQTVVLSGGCLQNRILREQLSRELREADLEVLLPERLPPNDGGLALGQALVACARVRADRRRREAASPTRAAPGAPAPGS